MAGSKDLEVTTEGEYLVIKIKMQTPIPSASGKTLVVCSTHGNKQTSVMVNGKPVTIGVNGYISAR